MTTTTLTKTARTVIAGTSNAAGSTTRGTLDLRTAQGGLLTVKLLNGVTGPTVAPTITVSVAHNAGATPASAAEGSDWKRFYQVGGSTTANDTLQWAIDVPASVMHLQVECTGNTGQAVTVEAYLSELTSASSV